MRSRDSTFPFGLPLMAILSCLGVFGCGDTQTTQSPYQTVAKDPRRDTDLARKLTAQAIDSIDQSKWPDAEALLKKALDADVTFGPAHNNLGTVYMYQNNLYLAAWEFQYAAKLMPYQPEPK